MKLKLIYLFLGFSVFYILLTLLNLESITFWLKPLLIPILSSLVLFEKEFPTKKVLLAALFFSWVGDVVLLFADKGTIFFIIGLVSFLIAHLLYILLFMKLQKVKTTKYLPYSILVLVYLIGLLSFLWNDLGDLKLPVLIYASVLSMMLLFAIKGKFVWENHNGNYILFGAIFFVLSDSLLAINKFHSPISLASFLIMSTYLVAQFLLVLGILKIEQKKEALNEPLDLLI